MNRILLLLGFIMIGLIVAFATADIELMVDSDPRVIKSKRAAEEQVMIFKQYINSLPRNEEEYHKHFLKNAIFMNEAEKKEYREMYGL